MASLKLERYAPEPVNVILTICLNCGNAQMLPEGEWAICVDCYFKLCDEMEKGGK